MVTKSGEIPEFSSLPPSTAEQEHSLTMYMMNTLDQQRHESSDRQHEQLERYIARIGLRAA